MAKIALVVFAVQVLASAAHLSPVSEGELALGVASGFVSDTDVLVSCGVEAVSEAMQLKDSLEDFKKAIMHFNITAIKEAINEVEAAAKAIPAAKEACEPLKNAAEVLLKALHRLHGPKDIVEHILDHLVEDGDKIFAELIAGDKSFKAGSAFVGAGQDFGMALRRMLVGEMNSTKPQPPIAGCGKSISEGMAIGFLSDSIDFAKCIPDLKEDDADLKKALKDLEEAIKHLDLKGAEAAIKEFHDFMPNPTTTEEICKTAIEKTKTDDLDILKKLKAMHGLKDLGEQLLHNLLTDSENIFGDLQKAAALRKNSDCMGAGREMGIALRRTLVGEMNSTEIVIV